MNLLDIVNRTAMPEPWSEGDNIPWNDPEFSERMLKEHLTQDHDAASRRFEKIDGHVAWIHQHVLSGQPTNILDLGCGPGLYASRFAKLGHVCTGIDYSPASIAYARAQAQQAGLRCTYVHQDLRAAEYGNDYGLAMFIYGEPNVFMPDHLKLILKKAHDALAPGGALVLEPHTFAAVEAMGKEGRRVCCGNAWFAHRTGLFSARPHVVMEENVWDAERHIATIRYYIVDAQTAEVTRYAQSMQAYTDDEYHTLLTDCGFEAVVFYPSLYGEFDESQRSLFAITAMRM